MDWSFIVIAVLAVLGVALIAGGIVAYRGSERVLVRALAAASIAAGTVMLALITFITPVSVVTNVG